MTWLIEDSPYWKCASCLNPPTYKPDECNEPKHQRYYNKLLRAKRERYRVST